MVSSSSCTSVPAGLASFGWKWKCSLEEEVLTVLGLATMKDCSSTFPPIPNEKGAVQYVCEGSPSPRSSGGRVSSIRATGLSCVILFHLSSMRLLQLARPHCAIPVLPKRGAISTSMMHSQSLRILFFFAVVFWFFHPLPFCQTWTGFKTLSLSH